MKNLTKLGMLLITAALLTISAGAGIVHANENKITLRIVPPTSEQLEQQVEQIEKTTKNQKTT